MTSAVVFAYHNVGVRGLKALLAGGVRVPLVVTHEDDENETIWFASVRRLCAEYDIPFITPADPNVPEVEAQVAALGADFLFSFYYRHLLKAPLLGAVGRGAYNLHGSLLPKYRGRAPVNWAIIHGERETGATLHRMNEKPDNGAIVDQVAVPILPDDTARDVFEKVTVAAELCLVRCLPGLIDGSAVLRAQDLAQGAYFGGRQAEDGRIDWRQEARRVHDLVRAVSHPYPGAFCDWPDGRLIVWRTRVLADSGVGPASGTIVVRGGRIELHPYGGGSLLLVEGSYGGASLSLRERSALPMELRLPA